MDEAFYAKYSLKLNEKSVSGPNGQCILWTGYVDKHGYGMINVKISQNKWANRGVHRISMIVHKKLSFEQVENLHVSHICHNKLCIAPHHLSVETSEINNNRLTCISMRHCMHHSPFPDCLLHLRVGEYHASMHIVIISYLGTNQAYPCAVIFCRGILYHRARARPDH